MRPARDDDLRAAAVIFAVDEFELDRHMHPLTGLGDEDIATKTEAALDDFRLLHGENPRQVWVAERDAIVGVAAAAMRSHHLHLTYLFVLPEAQAQGIGGELLRQIAQAGREAGCTVFTLLASQDPRALTRYFRLGLIPQAPAVTWTAPAPTFPPLGLGNPYDAQPLVLGDPAVLNTVADIDKAVRGVRRQDDIRRWLQEGATGALLIDRQSGNPAGYFLVSKGAGSGRIGPVAAIDEHAFGEVLTYALAVAGTHHEAGMGWKVAAPGENRALVAPLLAAGFRPSYGELFFASEPIGRFDRYIFHDIDLL